MGWIKEGREAEKRMAERKKHHCSEYEQQHQEGKYRIVWCGVCDRRLRSVYDPPPR